MSQDDKDSRADHRSLTLSDCEKRTRNTYDVLPLPIIFIRESICISRSDKAFYQLIQKTTLSPKIPTFTVFRGSKEGHPTKQSTTRPDELKEDQVRIKVTASGLCRTGTSQTVSLD